MDLLTADGERLHAVHLPGPASSPGRRVAVVLAHGFTGHTAKPALQRIADHLAVDAGVLAYDARGHGRSSGLSTLGDREVLDVDAAVAAARRLGYDAVFTCGWSMGGATVLRHAALRGQEVGGHRLQHAPEAVVAVSTTSRWFVRDTAGVAPLPLLLVHGETDAYVTLEHPHALLAAARAPVELWLEPGFSQAEDAAGPELLDRLARRMGVLVPC